MHRPLRDPLYLRVWHLIRGLLFYNTVYWRRASDGLNMPSLSAEERERQRPERNLEIIRPRARPRAHIEAARGGEISLPPASPLLEAAETAAVDEQASASAPAAFTEPQAEAAGEETEPVYVKRRRYRRRSLTRGSEVDRDSFLARVFGKK